MTERLDRAALGVLADGVVVRYVTVGEALERLVWSSVGQKAALKILWVQSEMAVSALPAVKQRELDA